MTLVYNRPMNNNIYEIQINLQKIAQTNLSNKSQVKTNALYLESLILQSPLERLKQIKEFINNSDLLHRLQVLYEEFETNLEIDFAKQVIQSNKTVKDYLLTKRFITLIKNEIRLGNMAKNHKVLFIGSGPFPISAILFNKLVGCHVDCYEKRKYRAELSNKALKKLDLSNSIKVYCKKGEDLSDDRYDIIVIALLAKTKNKILNKIFSVARPGTKIICRTADDVHKVFYEETEEKLLNKYKVYQKVFAKEDQTISSTLLIK